MSAISVQLARLRTVRGLTQQQLAERTGLRRDTISALERGKSRAIEFETLARLCDALQVRASDILALAPSAHTAPILGGEDEDEIIAERLADAEGELAALLADPALAGRGLLADTTAMGLAGTAPSEFATYPHRGVGEDTEGGAPAAQGEGVTADRLAFFRRIVERGARREPLTWPARAEGTPVALVLLGGGELIAAPLDADDSHALTETLRRRG